MERRITIRDIARKAGIHFTTVAKALREAPGVAEATRKKVRKIAKAMGYAPDPMLMLLSNYRRIKRPPSFRETLAWITSYPSPEGWRFASADAYFRGAKERAERLGYRLDEYWLKKPGLTARRASDILFSRGVRGLLISPLPVSRGHLSLEWRHFSAVAFGYTLFRPRIHMVTASHFRSVVIAVRHLRSLGFRRIGWANAAYYEKRADNLWKAAFWSELDIVPESRAIPMLTAPDLDKPILLKWYRKYRPEVILTIDNYLRAVDWLAEEGHAVPGEVSVAFVNLQEEGPIEGGFYSRSRYAGVVEDSFQVGATAVDVLSGMLQRSEKGVPSSPLRTLVDGRWMEGPTVKARRRLRQRPGSPS